MDNSATRAKATNLGNELVKALKLEPGGNTLTRWMAHYIAEQITLAENTTGPAKAAAEERCFNTILALWQQRRALPNGRRPFEDFEPILKTLGRLNPDGTKAFFHRMSQMDEATAAKENADVLKLMKFVDAVDVAARIVIELALESAAENASSNATKVMLREALPSTADLDLDIIRRMTEAADQAGPSDPRIELIAKRLDQLDWFLEISKGVRKAYADELKARRKQSQKAASEG